MVILQSEIPILNNKNDIVSISNKALDQLFENIESIESKMFDCLKFQYYRYYVKLTNGVRIWTITNVKPAADGSIYTNNKIPAEIDYSKEPILLLHGFMASAGFWLLNMDNLSQSKHPIYAIDLPGYSRSSRIDLGSNPLECEKNYINVIEEFLKCLNIEKLTIMGVFLFLMYPVLTTNEYILGHSMGGYLASAYALKNTHRMHNLLLIDPWGYEDIKELIVNNLRDGDWLTIVKELFNWRHYFRFIGLAISPYSYFSLFRTFGESFTVTLLRWVQPFFQKCYSHINNGTRDDLIIYKYIHHCSSCKYNNGELFMPLMCVRLGWPLRPMLPRLLSLTVNSLDDNESQSSNQNNSNTMRILFVYGEKSWVRNYPAYLFKQERRDLDVKIKIITNVGHLLVFEDPNQFFMAIEEYL